MEELRVILEIASFVGLVAFGGKYRAMLYVAKSTIQVIENISSVHSKSGKELEVLIKDYSKIVSENNGVAKDLDKLVGAMGLKRHDQKGS